MISPFTAECPLSHAVRADQAYALDHIMLSTPKMTQIPANIKLACVITAQ